jgi:exonuclease III
VKKYWQFNLRIILIKIEGDPADIVIMQVYKSASNNLEEEIEEIHKQLDEFLSTVKGKENLIEMGDWNAVVGEGKGWNTVGEFGLGKTNERGERFVEFSNKKNLMMANTLFMQHQQ